MAETYFNALNYSLANEDTSVELAALPGGVGHAVAVAGSGARVVPLLAREPRLLTCVDLSPAQLALVRTRLAAVRALDHEGYLSFLGYPCPSGRAMTPPERKACFAKLELPNEERRRLAPLFDQMEWGPIVYAGAWERAMIRIAGVVRRVLRRRLDLLFSSSSLEEHLRFMDRGFPLWRWRLLLLALGNATAFNALLYKGRHPEKTLPESHYRFYRRGFQRLFELSRPQENFFLQLMLLGRLAHPEGLPLEADPAVFASAKAALGRTEVRFLAGDVIDTLRAGEPFDFASLSDTPSYYSPTRLNGFLRELSAVARPAARVVARYYLRVPQHLDSDGWSRRTEDYRLQIDREKTQIYRIDVWERRP